MGKYKVRWYRIWDFIEEIEAETEEEAYEKILEERKTAGSTIEIISVMPINIEKVKQKGKTMITKRISQKKKEKK